MTLSPVADRFGTTTIVLTVTDGGGLTASETFIVTVPPPLPPVVVPPVVPPVVVPPPVVPPVIVPPPTNAEPRVVIYDGKSAAVIGSALVFKPTFTGGLFVATGDIDGDGVADLIVSPDEGGGPRVRVFRRGDFDCVIADFFGIEDANFRGGVRIAAGDLNADGRIDLIVAAGIGGGPRIAGFDGRSLVSGTPTKVFNDFFAFEDTLRNGAFVSVGDLNGDGRDDLITGAGPGGGPRVIAFNGTGLATNVQTFLANFFAGDIESRGGVPRLDSPRRR